MFEAIPWEGGSHHQLQGQCWERQLMLAVFWTPFSHIRIGLWAWNTSSSGDTESLACAGLVNSYGNAFLHFRLNVYSFILLKSVSNGTTAMSVPSGERIGSFILRHKMDACRPIALCQLPGGTIWPWETSTHYGSWSWSVSSLCEWSGVPSSASLCWVFLGDCDTKMQSLAQQPQRLASTMNDMENKAK